MRPRSASRASPDGSIRPLSMQAFQWVSEEFRFAASIEIAHTLHCSRGAARCVRSHIPGALSILKGAVPDRARGLGHTAPTYFRREPGIDAPTAIAAPHSQTLRPPLLQGEGGERSEPSGDLSVRRSTTYLLPGSPLPIRPSPVPGRRHVIRAVVAT